MTEVLYAKDSKIYNKEYLELYIPMSYFKDGKMAINRGTAVDTFGVIYARVKDGKVKFFSVPTEITLKVYESVEETLDIPNDKPIQVLTLKYLPNSYIMQQTIVKGREIAEAFLGLMLHGKLPQNINYRNLINLWWQNLDISGISFNVPSKIYELIIATVYRSPNSMKKRFGQWYGKSTDRSPYDYQTGSIREIVKNLSTFSGIAFEDMNAMISNGINNNIEEVETETSPLEKLIQY